MSNWFNCRVVPPQGHILLIQLQGNAATMSCPAIETFVFAFFKGDDGEKGDRGADGSKVATWNKNFNLTYPTTQHDKNFGKVIFLCLATLTPHPSFHSNDAIAYM